jgi:hypothetical protein
VDDFTSGPNRFLRQLWYDTDSILGGLVRGIYPGGDNGLTLDPVEGDPFAYPTLDIRINTDFNAQGVVASRTVLYDKRREPCYRGIPIVHYVHVSSGVSARVGPYILRGQLHRLSQIIMCRDNFVVESRHVVAALLERGYHTRTVFKVLRRFLVDNYYIYGDNNRRALWKDVCDGLGTANVPGPV